MKENRADEYIAVLALFIPVCTIAVALRCYCRVVLVKSFGLDDWFSLLSIVLFLVFSSFALSGIKYGTGRMQHLIPKDDFPVAMQWWWACEPTYVLGAMALKQSIAIFLLRLAVHRVQRMVLYVTITITQIYSTYFLFLFIFQCWPISHFWNQYRGGAGHCIGANITTSSFYAYSAVSCAADWIFSIVPIFMVWNLQMDKKVKVYVAVMLAFAAIASTATIVRIPYIRGFEDTNNFLYATIDVAIWSTAETGLGIATSCVATLRPLLRKIKESTGHSSEGTGTGWQGRSGYHRNIHSEHNHTNIMMRDDLKNDVGVTTVVGIGKKGNRITESRRGSLSRSASVTALKDPSGWNHSSSDSKLNDGDSDDYLPIQSDFEVRKTVQITQS